MSSFLDNLINVGDEILSHQFGLKPAPPIKDTEMTVDFGSVSTKLDGAIAAIRGGNVLEALNTITSALGDVRGSNVESPIGTVVTIAEKEFDDLTTAVNDITSMFNDVKHGNVNWIDIFDKLEKVINDINVAISAMKSV